MSVGRSARALALLGLGLLLISGLPRSVPACKLKYVEDRSISRVFPYYSSRAAERRAVDLLFEPLVRETAGASNSSLLLDLSAATSNPEQTEWTFPLLPTYWHSGKPLIADDIVRTFKELQRLNKEGWVTWTQELAYFPWMQEIRAGSNAIVVRYTKKIARESAEASLRNFYVVPWAELPDLDASGGKLEEYVPNTQQLKKSLVGNGRWGRKDPDPIITTQGGVRLTAFRRFPLQRGTAAPADTITQVQSYVEPLSGERVDRFISGQVNVLLDVPASSRTAVLAVAGAETQDLNQDSFTFVQICKRNSALEDPKVREALIYAVNRKEILNSRFGGRGDIIDAPFPPSSFCFNSTVPVRSWDQKKAVQLIQAAGFTGSEKTGWKKGDLTLGDLTFLIETNLAGTDIEQVAHSIVDDWANIGVHVELEREDPQTYAQMLKLGNYDFAYAVYTSGNAWNLLRLLSDDDDLYERPENKFLYCSPAVKAKLKEYDAIEAGDQEKASAVGQQLHAEIAKSCDRIYLWSLKEFCVYNTAEISFTPLGPTVFEGPFLWQCGKH